MILEPTIPVEVETRKNVFISQSRAGVRKTVIKSGGIRFYTLDFKYRNQEEYLEKLAEFETHYPGTAFSWTNADLGASGFHYFESELKAVVENPNTFSYSVDVRARDAIVPSNPGTTVFPFKPNFAYDITNVCKVLISDSIAFARVARSTSDVARQFQYTFRNRTLTELLTAENFWAFHYPVNQITFDDDTFDEEMTFFIDSNFKWTVNGVNLIDYTFVFTEVLEAPAPPTASVPTDPSVLAAESISESRIDLSWNDNSSSETGFSIERCEGVGCTDFTEIVTVPHNQETFIDDDGLTSNTLYRYRVRAFNAAGYSGFTNIAEATTSEAFNPLSVDGATEWVSGDQSSLSSLVNNDPVTTWLDRVSSTRSWGATGTTRPFFKTGGPNGLPYLAFDADDDMTWSSTISTMISSTGYTVFAVVRAHRNGVNDDPWLCPQFGGTLNGYYGLSLRNTGSGNKFVLWQDRGGSFTPRAQGVSSTTTFVQDVWYIVEGWWDGTSMHIKVNNDAEVSATFNNPASLANSISIGAGSLSSDVAERITYNVSLTTIQRAQIRQYLASKYAITLAP